MLYVQISVAIYKYIAPLLLTARRLDWAMQQTMCVKCFGPSVCITACKVYTPAKLSKKHPRVDHAQAEEEHDG